MRARLVLPLTATSGAGAIILALGAHTLRRGARTLGEGVHTLREGARTFSFPGRTFSKGVRTFGVGVRTFCEGVHTLGKNCRTHRKGAGTLPEIWHPGGCVSSADWRIQIPQLKDLADVVLPRSNQPTNIKRRINYDT
jgi:hypothetical protein